MGSNINDLRGNIIEDITEANNLAILNDGPPTHFNAANAGTSYTDLTLCSMGIVELFEWDTVDNLLCSEHYQIIIRIEESSNVTPIFTPR